MSAFKTWSLAGALLLGAALFLGASGLAPARADQAKAAAEAQKALVTQGQRIFKADCAACHRAKSQARKIGPGLAGLFKAKLTPAMKHPVSDEEIEEHIHEGGPRMPAFPGIKGRDMDALLAYLKTL